MIKWWARMTCLGGVIVCSRVAIGMPFVHAPEVWCESSLVRLDSRHRLLGALTRIRPDIPLKFVKSARPRAVFEFFSPEVLNFRAKPIFLRAQVRDDEAELEMFRPGRRPIDDQFLALIIAVNGHSKHWRHLTHPRDFGHGEMPSQTGPYGFKSPGQKPLVNFRYVEFAERPGGVSITIGIDVPCREQSHFSFFESNRAILENLRLSCRVPVLTAWYPYRL